MIINNKIEFKELITYLNLLGRVGQKWKESNPKSEVIKEPKHTATI